MNIAGFARNGLLVALLVLTGGFAVSSVAADSRPADGGKWEINLRDADIRAFIDQVSAMTGKTFVVDQRVKGKITVIAPEPMNSATVYQVFLSVLSVNGFAAVPTGRVIKIVPDGTAKQDSIPLDTSAKPSGEDIVTRVIGISHSSAAELVPVLRPMVPQSGHMAAVTGANVLVVTDHAENIARLEEVIARIDGADADEIEVVQLRHAWVGDVLELLGSFSLGGGGDAAKASAARGALTAGRVRLVADDRTNRIVLRGEKSARERMRRLIDIADVPTEANTGSVQVIRLKYAEAKKAAEILKGMVDGGGSTPAASAQGGAALVNPVGAKVAIQADETLNALVVRAEPSVMQQLRVVISQLDVRRAQVLIEAAIVEVGGSTGRDLGVQWASGDPDSGLVGVNFSGVGRSLNEIASAVVNPASARGLGEGVTLAGGKRDNSGRIEFGGIVQALASSANVNLLSTPSVLTLDNQEAKIIVGENVPFITGSSTAGGDGASNPFTTIKREDVGIQLKVTPTLIDDDNIKLVINQEVSSVKPSEDSVQSSDIITSKRSISTTVLAANKQTIVLGGLIEDRVSETVKKVPLLGDIPVLGILFRSKSVSRGKQNLMVFLRPSVLADSKAASDASWRKYRGVRALAFEIDARGDIARVQESEVLPEQMGRLFLGLGGDPLPAGPAKSGSAAPVPVAAVADGNALAPAAADTAAASREPVAAVGQGPASAPADAGSTATDVSASAIAPSSGNAAAVPSAEAAASSPAAAEGGPAAAQSVE